MTKVLGNDGCMIVYIRSSQLLWMYRQVDGQESNQSVAPALPRMTFPQCLEFSNSPNVVIVFVTESYLFKAVLA
jgi:hypothetical protein